MRRVRTVRGVPEDSIWANDGLEADRRLWI